MSTNDIIQKNGQSSVLVVLLRGWDDNPELYTGLLDEVHAREPNADIFMPTYRKGIFHNEDPFEVASRMETQISEAYEASAGLGKPYERIILIGYSMGALIIRKAYVYGRGSEEDRAVPNNTSANEWTKHVERILLLAGVNRGWSLDNRPKNMSFVRFVTWRYIYTPIGRLLPNLKMLKEIERGAPFVINLRIQWLRLIQREAEQIAPVVQLLGTIDNIVSAADDRDLYVHRDFIFIPVEDADHGSLIRFDDSEVGQRAKSKFAEGLTQPIRALRDKYAEQQHVSYELLPQEARHIVFLLHGIRDYGGWTGELREEFGRLANQLKLPVPKVVTAKYDFFSFAKFILSRFLPRQRHKYLLWFMDQYTEQLATFPNSESKVSFVGHSNGTYLLASALLQYQTMRIHRASFAGSVVPREYPWERIIMQERRLDALRNDIATADWAVGFFPKLFDQLNMSDVGSGGFDGFNDDAGNQMEGRYYKGQHGAAIQPGNYESLARFILTGEIQRDAGLLKPTQSAFVVAFSRFSIVPWALAVFLVLVAPVLLVLYTPLLVAFLYILLVLWVLNQV
jgi:predicted esterase